MRVYCVEYQDDNNGGSMSVWAKSMKQAQAACSRIKYESKGDDSGLCGTPTITAVDIDMTKAGVLHILNSYAFCQDGHTDAEWLLS